MGAFEVKGTRLKADIQWVSPKSWLTALHGQSQINILNDTIVCWHPLKDNNYVGVVFCWSV